MTHQWAYPQVIAMLISVGLFTFVLIICVGEIDTYYDYLNVGTYVMGTPFFWFMGMWTVGGRM